MLFEGVTVKGKLWNAPRFQLFVQNWFVLILEQLEDVQFHVGRFTDRIQAHLLERHQGVYVARINSILGEENAQITLERREFEAIVKPEGIVR